MLKGKSKAFKPKGPVRRPGAGAPSREPTRESTREPTPSDSAILKRKERDDDAAAHPPSKRLATPDPVLSSSPKLRKVSTPRTATRRSLQNPLPTPESTATQSTLSESVLPDSTIPAALPAIISPARSSIPSPEPSQDVPAANLSPTATIPTFPVVSTQSRSPRPASKLPQRPPAHSKTTPVAQPESGVIATLSPSSAPASQPTIHARNAPTPTSSVPATKPVPVLLPSLPTPSVSTSSSPSNDIPATSTNNFATTETRSGASPGPVGAASASIAPSLRAVNSESTGEYAASNVPRVAASLGGAGDVGEQMDKTQGFSQLVPMASLNPDGTAGGIIEPLKTKAKRKVVKRKKKLVEGQPEGQTDDEQATLDMETGLAKPRRNRAQRDAEPREPRPRKERKEREDTPSDAEEQIVDTAALTMSDLCKDLRIGKKFSRHDDIKARVEKQKERVKARRQARANGELTGLLDGLQPNGVDEEVDILAANAEASGAQSTEGSAINTIEPPEVIGPGGQSVMMRIVDGQIVVDERSIQVDRHRNAQDDSGPTEIVEENDFTRIITSNTYAKRERSQRWDWPSLDKFYRGLKLFGTDFGMIANMFPDRTRKQVKLRFNREEKENPDLINRTLAGEPLPINLQEYMEISGKNYVDLSEIAAESKALDDQHKDDLAAIERRKNAANKKKKDAIHGRNSAKDILDALSDDDEHHASAGGEKENRAPSIGGGPGGGRSREASSVGGPARRGKKGKKAAANKHSMRAGGDVVEVVGSIE